MSNDDYTVGYKKPPRSTQFKPKQSGNPAGKPTKKKKPENTELTQSELDGMIKAELDREVVIAERGKQKKLTLRQLVVRSQINTAAKGNPVAQRDIMKTMRDLELRDTERAEAERQRLEKERQEDILIYNYRVGQKQRRLAVWVEAESRGVEPDCPWPHPDDILLFPAQQRWEIRGPINASDVSLFEYYRAERDHYFADTVAKDRTDKRRSDDWRKIDMLLWMAWDAQLPLRWQVAGNCEKILMLFRAMPLADLKRHVNDCAERCKEKKLLAGLPPADKDIYRKTNKMMKPLLQRHGYRSLAEFEQAFDIHGENMPWPKITNEKSA